VHVVLELKAAMLPHHLPFLNSQVGAGGTTDEVVGFLEEVVGFRVVVGGLVDREDVVGTLVGIEVVVGGLVGREVVGGSGERIVRELEDLVVGTLLCKVELVVGAVESRDEEVVTSRLVVASVEDVDDEAGNERYQFALPSPRHSPTVTPVQPLARI
jgi:hypothetical protein